MYAALKVHRYPASTLEHTFPSLSKPLTYGKKEKKKNKKERFPRNFKFFPPAFGEIQLSNPLTHTHHVSPENLNSLTKNRQNPPYAEIISSST